MSASKNLEGRTIVITGASAGIGRSTAFEFARQSPKNLKLILTARRLDALQEIASEIEKEVGNGVKVCPVKLDVSNPTEIKGFLSSLPEDFRDIDVLVNNAGVAYGGMHQSPDIDPTHIDLMFSTNVTGPILLTQTILPIFLSRPSGGRGDIINIGSVAGRDPYAGGSIYCATKAAMRSFTEALRKELIATRVRVMEIDPGQVATDFSKVRFGGDEEKARKVYEGCEPMRPDDIAEIIVFAVSRRENVVLADSLVFPSYQAGAVAVHRKL